jgi:hypothetical protein
MQHPYFFGYGSLVNRRTHDFAPCHRATIRGWRRAWCATALRRVAFLTALPDPGAETLGLIAPVPNDDWAALDAREAAYDRHEATAQVIHEAGEVSRIAVYSIAPENRVAPSEEHPILMSYLDVVVQGFLAEYGEEGAQAFFDTTQGWETPILNDRAKPVYPRAQALSTSDRALVDDGLARLDCRVLTERAA